MNIPLVVQLSAPGITLKGSAFQALGLFSKRAAIKADFFVLRGLLNVHGGLDRGEVTLVCVCQENSGSEREGGEGVLLFTPAVFNSAVTKQNTGISGHRVNTMTEPVFFVQEMSGLVCFKQHAWTKMNRLIIDDLKCP